MARVITVTSGKGGVGKTNISVNLAVRLARDGFKTCIFDADLGLANINILLGISPEYNLEDVISGEKSLADILVRDPSGVDIIPGGTGVEQLANIDPGRLTELIRNFSCLADYDFLIFDTSAGISRDVLSFCMASMEVLLVVIPEPTSLTDGYSLLKVISLNGYREPVKVIINRAKNDRFAQAVFNKFNETVQKFLPLDLLYAGCLPADEGVSEAVARQRPFVSLYPDGRAASGITRLAATLADTSNQDPRHVTLDTFWDRYAKFLQSPTQLPRQKRGKKSADAEKKSPVPKPAPPAQPLKTADVAPPPPAESTAGDMVSRQILESINRLVTVTTNISQELSEFRRVITPPESAGAADNEPDAAGTESQLPPIIALDFEAYVERKKAKRKIDKAR